MEAKRFYSLNIKEDGEKINNMKTILYSKVKNVISHWDLENVKVIGMIVQKFDKKYIDVVLSYNSWDDYEAISDKEECWNYACWNPEHEEILIDEKNQVEIRRWLEEKGVIKIGADEGEDIYDENGFYVGPGPNGMKEFIEVLVEIVKQMHQDEIVKKKTGSDLPILITDLEYSGYFIKATEEANDMELIEDFLKWVYDEN